MNILRKLELFIKSYRNLYYGYYELTDGSDPYDMLLYYSLSDAIGELEIFLYDKVVQITDPTHEFYKKIGTVAYIESNIKTIYIIMNSNGYKFRVRLEHLELYE